MDVQQSDSQTGAIMNQKHIRIRGDSQNSGNTKLILGVHGRVVSFLINVYRTLLPPYPKHIHVETLGL